MRDDAVYVSNYGALWRLSHRSFHRFLRHAANGHVWNLDSFGKRVATDFINTTDMSPEIAQTLLIELEARK